ncbi:GNAT family N-acetyltransferase [Sphaerisporangium sp. NPDC049003]|uniref:GNAT family N-acetyltransferase n=1 Tax=Sphaerisporangium sp. NPDC049003 TaxID=3364517 RepID=UPI0037156516
MTSARPLPSTAHPQTGAGDTAARVKITTAALTTAAPTTTVRGVAYDDPAAVALREAMGQELRARYADRLADPGHLPRGMDVDSATVAYTGVAYSAEGVPVGHLLLRRAGADLELKRMYVAPGHRGTGVSTALLSAAEAAARGLGAARVILQTGDRQPDAVRLYEREGYTPIPIFPPYEPLPYSHCFEKVIGS